MSGSVVTVEGSRRDLTGVRDPEGIVGWDVRGRGIKSLADLERATPSVRSLVCGSSIHSASCVCAESRTYTPIQTLKKVTSIAGVRQIAVRGRDR
jgi:hypothetical protein